MEEKIKREQEEKNKQFEATSEDRKIRIMEKVSQVKTQREMKI